MKRLGANWDSLNIKTPSYQYKNSHDKNKTARPSYIYNGNPHTWKDHLYIETGPKSSTRLTTPIWDITLHNEIIWI